MNEEQINNQLEAEKEDSLEGKYLTFNIDGSNYGISIRDISEVIRIQPITEVPNVEPYTKGLINLRGKVIPVIDLRLRFFLPEIETDSRTCIVIVDVDGERTGLIVDTVTEVIEIPKDKIELYSKTNQSTQSKFISCMGKTEKAVFLILDVKLIVRNDFEEIQL